MTEPVQIVDIRAPAISLVYDFFGGVDIKCDDFVFVHINYDYRYTCNSHRTWLAEEIKKLLEGNQTQLLATIVEPV
jgi:hypothetical protein